MHNSEDIVIIPNNFFYLKKSKRSSIWELETILKNNEKLNLSDMEEFQSTHGQVGHKGYKRLKLKEVLERFRQVHENKYGYKDVVYKNANSPVRVMCPEHGQFFIRPVSHWRGVGCQKCKKK